MTLRRLKRHLQAVDHKWGFIDVRPECHMFYWLFLTTHPNGWQTRPLVVWLQVVKFKSNSLTVDGACMHVIA